MKMELNISSTSKHVITGTHCEYIKDIGGVAGELDNGEVYYSERYVTYDDVVIKIPYTNQVLVSAEVYYLENDEPYIHLIYRKGIKNEI